MSHYCGPETQAPWNAPRWPNFTPAEIACRCCGEVYIDETALDALQRLRHLLGGPLTVASGHRCEAHNRRIGGAARSVHLQLAFDLALGRYARGPLLAFAREAGFVRFGLMQSGLHVDTHPIDAAHAPMWTYGKESRRLWRGLFPPETVDIGGDR
jgi:zinc D-Ala-D-Ala carboxypeptidase